ncbi:hypothetical protein [Marinoscillum furvescens]|nr:hypothetical protein [Marinoscillum furvescens]
MKSNSGYTFFFKNFFLLFAMLSVFGGAMGYLFPESVTVNGKPANFEMYDYVKLGGVCILSVIRYLLFSPHFLSVKLGGQNITILDYEPEKLVNWTNVESIRKFWFVFPPLYKLKIKNEEGYYLFTTQPTYMDTGIGTADLSFMGSFIRRKKKELNI